MNRKCLWSVARLAALLIIASQTIGSNCLNCLSKEKEYTFNVKCQFQLWQNGAFLRTIPNHLCTLRLCKVSEDEKKVTSFEFQMPEMTDQNGNAEFNGASFGVKLDNGGLFATEKVRATGVMVYQDDVFRASQFYAPNVQEDPDVHDFNFAVEVDI